MLASPKLYFDAVAIAEHISTEIRDLKLDPSCLSSRIALAEVPGNHRDHPFQVQLVVTRDEDEFAEEVFAEAQGWVTTSRDEAERDLRERFETWANNACLDVAYAHNDVSCGYEDQGVQARWVSISEFLLGDLI